jgi:hypothetical protein
VVVRTAASKEGVRGLWELTLRVVQGLLGDGKRREGMGIGNGSRKRWMEMGD